MTPKNNCLVVTAERVTDFVIAFIAIIFLAPIMLLIGIAVKLDSSGPAIFKQNRVGKKCTKR